MRPRTQTDLARRGDELDPLSLEGDLDVVAPL